MKITETERLLAAGLSAGYAGKSGFERVRRGGFVGEQSFFTDGKGGIYVDQWFAHQRGGGQELAVLENGEKITRLYAGGTVGREELARIGITEGQLSAQLKKSLEEAGPRTRLREDYIPAADGDWNYSYRVLAHVAELDLTLGLEELAYGGNLTFAHYFLISPVR